MNFKQINAVSQLLGEKRKIILSEILLQNKLIKNKQSSLDKITNYYEEYVNKQKSKIMGIVPALVVSHAQFTNKILLLMEKEKKEILALSRKINYKIDELHMLDNKINALSKISSQLLTKKIKAEDYKEQINADQLVSSAPHWRNK